MEKIVAWVEIPTENMEKSVAFYNDLFGLDLKIDDYGAEKMACFPSGEGAISQSDGFKPGAGGLMVSFHAVDDLESSIRRVLKNGGSLIIPKTKIEAEGRGYFCVIADPEGNRIGLYGEA